MTLVDEVTVTTIPMEDECVFTVRISRLELSRISHRRILGFLFPRNKYEYLNEVSKIITAEVVKKLKEMPGE
jgi:hypothetical protein